MKVMRLSVAALAGLLLLQSIVGATPSSIILIPSTDTLARGVAHVDVDTVFTVGQGAANASAVSVGATCGVTDRLEVGFDWLSDTTNPLVGNVKWVPYSNESVNIALGAWLLGNAGSSGANQVYALVSCDTHAGRFAVGGAFGSKATLGTDEDQLWVSYDRALGEKWWAGADYISGDSPLGSLNVGVGYTVSGNTGVIVGYDAYNASGSRDTVTVQVDINF